MYTNQDIKHLFWRAGFGFRAEEYAKEWTRKDALEYLYVNSTGKRVWKSSLSPSDYSNLRTWRNRGKLPKAEILRVAKLVSGYRNRVVGNWIQEMVDTKKDIFPLRMSLFWHRYFPCKSNEAGYVADHIMLLKSKGLGDFRSLLLAVAKDPIMMTYLDTVRNKKQNPNENFARELLELFTIGIGHYTEEDIKEASRAFTGWGFDKITGEYQFNPSEHDTGVKRFMGKSGRFKGEDIIDIILEKRQTAYTICRKIYQYFVHPKYDQDLIKELGDWFYESNYNIGALMLRIFTSDWFYDDKNISAKIKSPIDLIVGLQRQLNLKIPDVKGYYGMQVLLDQKLFEPKNVAGWSGDRQWINSQSLPARLTFGDYLLGLKRQEMVYKADAEAKTVRVPSKVKLGFEANTFFESTSRFDSMFNYLISHNQILSRNDKTMTGLRQILSSIDYQLC